MMRTSRNTLLALTLALAAPLAAQDPAPAPAQAEPQQLFTVEELDNLLAPVALYPDPILAQLLVAATYPDQIALAARYVRTYGQEGIDSQAWDVSVKAIAHYPPVLNMLDERPDWATALGQAYALQEGDVMAAVQGLRKMALQQGNLVSTAEQKVETEGDEIRIVPAQPRVIYVPTYDPYYVYYQPVYYHRAYTPYWTFGVAFPIGVWLTYDFDWHHRVVYYHGWDGYGHHHTWYHVSRPFISFNSIYINYRRVVVVNRHVIHRRVRYDRFHDYNWVHRRVAWDRRDLPGRFERRDDDDVGRRYPGGEAQRGGRYVTRRAVAEAPAAQPSAPRTAQPRTAQPRGGQARTAPQRTAPQRTAPQRTAPQRAAPQRNDSRVSPTRVGSVNRPYYPGTDATERSRESTSDRGNGTWNARPTTDRTSTPRATPRMSDRQVARVPSSRGVTVDRSPRASAPTTSAPRASAPRASAPRSSAPPRASAPRSSGRSAPAASSRPSRGGERSAPARSEGRSARSKKG